MEKIIVQISKIAACEHLSIGALEKKIDASKGVLAKAIANNTDIQAKWVQKIAENFPQYSAEWLLTGEGPMLKGAEAVTEAAPPSPPIQAEGSPMADALLAQLAEKDRQIAQLLAIISNK